MSKQTIRVKVIRRVATYQEAYIEMLREEYESSADDDVADLVPADGWQDIDEETVTIDALNMGYDDGSDDAGNEVLDTREES